MVINGYLWDVVFVNPHSVNLMRSDGVMTLGVTDSNDMCIYISSALRGTLLKRVLTHEICHACVFSYGIYMVLDEEERLCEFVAIHAEEIINKSAYLLNSIKDSFKGGAV